eukprot:8118812-Heterocapsa_arctica.AAC.1
MITTTTTTTTTITTVLTQPSDFPADRAAPSTNTPRAGLPEVLLISPPWGRVCVPWSWRSSDATAS